MNMSTHAQVEITCIQAVLRILLIGQKLGTGKGNWAMAAELNRRGIGTIKTYEFWTNFNYDNHTYGDYEVVDQPKKGYWWFKTTLDLEFLDIFMTVHDRTSFLWQMLKHYGRKSEVTIN